MNLGIDNEIRRLGTEGNQDEQDSRKRIDCFVLGDVIEQTNKRDGGKRLDEHFDILSTYQSTIAMWIFVGWSSRSCCLPFYKDGKLQAGAAEALILRPGKRWVSCFFNEEQTADVSVAKSVLRRWKERIPIL